MKKIILGILVTMTANITVAGMAWSAGQLIGNIPDIDEDSAGWLVQMYRDAGTQTELDSVTFDLEGNPTGAGGSTSDEVLASFTLALQFTDVFEPEINFSGLDIDYEAIRGYNVYTVILDTDSWANATAANRTFVLDTETYAVPDQDSSNPINYSVPNTNPGDHEWSLVPEPGTMALLTMGLLGAFAIRRKRLG